MAPAAPEISGALVAPAGQHIENLSYQICARDPVIINSMAHFIRNIHDPLARVQALPYFDLFSSSG